MMITSPAIFSKCVDMLPPNSSTKDAHAQRHHDDFAIYKIAKDCYFIDAPASHAGRSAISEDFDILILIHDFRQHGQASIHGEDIERPRSPVQFRRAAGASFGARRRRATMPSAADIT